MIYRTVSLALGMEDFVSKAISQMASELNSKLETAMKEAALKNGIPLSIETANEFHVIEYSGWKTLLHIPTQTHICKYKSMPDLLPHQILENGSIKVSYDMEFTEL